MESVAQTLNKRVPAVRALDLPGTIHEFGAGVINELDYTIEAYNAQQFVFFFAAAGCSACCLAPRPPPLRRLALHPLLLLPGGLFPRRHRREALDPPPLRALPMGGSTRPVRSPASPGEVWSRRTGRPLPGARRPRRFPDRSGSPSGGAAGRRCASSRKAIRVLSSTWLSVLFGRGVYSFDLSGPFLEQCRWDPELLESFRELGETGNIEFTGSCSNHSLSSLYPDLTWFREEVLVYREMIRELIGVTPKNFRKYPASVYRKSRTHAC